MKKFNLIIFVFLIPFVSLKGQTNQIDVSGKEVLERTIKYHDPDNLWESYKGKLFEVTVFPNNYVVKETIEIDIPNDFYLSTCFQEFGTLKRGLDKGKPIFSLDDKPEIPDNIKNNWGISEKGIKRFNAQHHGHFGLPMVLKKSGMKLLEDVKVVDFDGRKCYVLTFIGNPDLEKNPFFIGERELYIDINNYAMRGLKYITENNRGYVLFSGEVEINGIKVVHAKCVFNEDGKKLSSSLNILPKN